MKSCPMNDYECPYFGALGCELGSAETDCEAFADYWEEEDWDEGFDPYAGCYTYDC